MDVGRLDDIFEKHGQHVKHGRPCFSVFENLDVHVFKTCKTWTSMFFLNMDDRMLFKIEHQMFDSIVVLV